MIVYACNVACMYPYGKEIEKTYKNISLPAIVNLCCMSTLYDLYVSYYDLLMKVATFAFLSYNII